MIWATATLFDFTNEEYRLAYQNLSPTRRAYIDTLTHEQRRKQSLAGEMLLKRLVAQQTGQTNVTIHRDDYGKPFVETDGVYVSMAHCDDVVVCAVNSTPVGVDIERIRSDIGGKLIDRVCTAEEAVYVRKQDTAKRFCEVWTSKEAYMKMVGRPLEHFSTVSVPSNQRYTVQYGEYIVQIVTAEPLELHK